MRAVAYLKPPPDRRQAVADRRRIGAPEAFRPRSSGRGESGLGQSSRRKTPLARRSGRDAEILGYDAAGVVFETGSDARLFRNGDAVYYAGAVGRQGANAEFHLMDERIVGRKPSALSFAEPRRCRLPR